MAVAVAALVAVRAVVPHTYFQPSNDVGGGYLQTVGTIYAVLLAFVVFVVWTQSNDARRLVERQADELADVLRIAAALKGRVAPGVTAAARAYAQEVADREWPLLAVGGSSPRAADLFERIWDELAAFEPRMAREEVLFGKAVSRFSEAGDARGPASLWPRSSPCPLVVVTHVRGGRTGVHVPIRRRAVLAVSRDDGLPGRGSVVHAVPDPGSGQPVPGRLEGQPEPDPRSCGPRGCATAYNHAGG